MAHLWMYAPCTSPAKARRCPNLHCGLLKVATGVATSQATRLVGPGCCRSADLVERSRTAEQDVTLIQCARECASTDGCIAFAISGCSSSSDAICGGSCHLYLRQNEQELTTASCIQSKLSGNTFCYALE